MTETGLAAVLLDFDGVVLKSVAIKTRAFRELFAEYPEQLEEIVALHEAHAGVSRYEQFRVIYREILHQPCDETLMRQLGVRFSTLVMDEVIRCPFVRGAEEFLEQFGARYALFLISGTPQNELREIIRRRGLAVHFHDVYGSPRPKTDIMRGILTTHQWPPERVMAVGDSMTDYRAAHALNIPFIGVVPGRQASPFAGIEGLPIVADLAELAACWDQWSPTGSPPRQERGSGRGARGTGNSAPMGATSRPPIGCCTSMPPTAEGRGAMAGLTGTLLVPSSRCR